MRFQCSEEEFKNFEELVETEEIPNVSASDMLLTLIGVKQGYSGNLVNFINNKKSIRD